jgi:hypothetical protein
LLSFYDDGERKQLEDAGQAAPFHLSRGCRAKENYDYEQHVFLLRLLALAFQLSKNDHDVLLEQTAVLNDNVDLSSTTSSNTSTRVHKAS